MRTIWAVVPELVGEASEHGTFITELARSIATECGWACTTVVVSGGSCSQREQGPAGLEHGVLSKMHPSPSPHDYAISICAIAKVQEPSLMVFPSTIRCQDIACRVATILGTPALLQCCGWHQIDGIPVLERPVLGGGVTANHPCGDVMCVATFSSSSDRVREKDSGHDSVPTPDWIVVEVQEGCDSASGGVRSLGLEQGSPLDAAIDDVDLLVAGGRGVGGIEGFSALKELAQTIGAGLGGSRIAVDCGWISRQRQVGQTGKTVRPLLYIACGISGSPHHVLGMKEAAYVVSINTDREAPMNRVADVVAIADCRVLVPLLVKRLRELGGGVSQ